MYHFDKNLYKISIELMHKNKELVDLLYDYQRIDVVLNNFTKYSLQYMREIDCDIRMKYIEISIFKNILDGVKWKEYKNDFGLTTTIAEIENLKFDAYFLCALVLIRTGEIARYEDFLDRNYIIFN